jgi:molybdate transport system regulatory protein
VARKPARPIAIPTGQAARREKAAEPVVRFRVRVTAGDVIAIGPGKVDLLEAIGRTGSITVAAKSLGMSYRRAWILLDTLNRSLRKPAVDSARGGKQGGGSALTETGRRLVALYRRIESTADAACRRDIERLVGLLAR